ncbi:MAG: hypothetical protein AAGD34_15770, partial [Pseudomonadota bacterium]
MAEMRAALIISALFHFAIVAAAIVSLPQADPFSTPAVVALPVELVTISEETDLTLGNPDATEVVEEAAPETVEADGPPEEMPGATDREGDTIATDENAVESAAESLAPEPSGTPETVEPEADDTAQTEVASGSTVSGVPEGSGARDSAALSTAFSSVAMVSPSRSVAPGISSGGPSASTVSGAASSTTSVASGLPRVRSVSSEIVTSSTG